MAACEEIDVVDSWEEIEESGVLDRKLTQPETPSPDDSEIMPRGTINGPIILQGEDSLRTQYVPPEPTVKILKRPARNNVHGTSEGPLLNGDSKPRQPIKTLQQREQEYAEARLRILGEARSPEEQLQIATNDRNNPQTKEGNLSFIDDVNLKKYSSTYKILHGNLQQVFSDNSSSDADDVGTQRKAKKEGGDNSQEHFKVTNSVQRCKKPSSLGGLGGVQYVPCYSDEKKN
ncbi:SUZ domain-containing protein 1 isoform X2 [Zootermopsis nevadensis]|uniref:SUZ domain-containing protein 1 isoform X2 n=1 Tax=Zootermopsis nevadensis TaxID=136037 RepID=UPI000B8ED732|nr:SUZ domain-containing protein 1 isoform X2 [Zootermopsis nevadensis]